MATEDRSRSAFYPGKHYAGVRMQQGRVLTDDDYNEGSQIQHEDMRATRADVIGPHGSPDQGFLISNVRLERFRVNFDIHEGTYYIGGLRAKLERIAPEQSGQTFREQTDWLQNRGLPCPRRRSDRFDFVYLEVWQQPVSAVEDEELLEAALGGPDTAVRMRTMARVKVDSFDNHPGSCHEAGRLFVQSRIGGSADLWDPRTNELRSDAKLTVSYVGADGDDDLCSPQRTGGYLGAENQAIRVQLVNEGDAFTWGFDNGAPLYRVQVSESGDDSTTIRMLTPPKDHQHWPVAGQVVELLPWGAVLPNGEKLAEELEAPRYLRCVRTDYDPDAQTLTIEPPINPRHFRRWTRRPHPPEINLLTSHFGKPHEEFLYLRIWDRGSDLAESPDEIALSVRDNVGNPVAQPLGHTGLAITITGEHLRTGDYWTIAARPETPDESIPWELDVGRPPDGIRRFYAPLALIHWRNRRAVEIFHCRRTFRPLTDLKTCCSYTVGDGDVSHGDFDKIQDAIDHLPATGGEVCILPGSHEGITSIDGLSNIRIKGCGEQSRVRSTPVFRITNSSQVTIDQLDLASFEGSTIEIRASTNVKVGRNRIFARVHGVDVQEGVNVQIYDNRIRMLDCHDGEAAIIFHGEGGLIERNDIAVHPAGSDYLPPEAETQPNADPAEECVEPGEFQQDTLYLDAYLGYVWTIVIPPFSERYEFSAQGGVQIASGSEQVRVLENRIRGGASNGITLGSDASDLLETLVGTLAYVSGEPNAVVHTRDASVLMRVMRNGTPISNYPVLFVTTSSASSARTAMSDEDGYIVFNDAAGADVYVYTMISDDRLRIAETTEEEDENTYGFTALFAEVDTAETVEEPKNSNGIYEISIQDNEVFDMGRSGIGIPRLDRDGAAPPTNEAVERIVGFASQVSPSISTVPLVDIVIAGNLIARCLQQPIGAEAEVRSGALGQGGVSLEMCERLTIQDNRIEDNGVNGLRPTCGIFVSSAAQIDVSGNNLSNNGALSHDLNLDDIRSGMRGGIVLLNAYSEPVDHIEGEIDVPGRTAHRRVNVSEMLSSIAGRRGFAARIHHNVVEQPIGQALLLLANGPLLISDNVFDVTISPSDVRQVGRTGRAAEIAGAVVIGNSLPAGPVSFSCNQTRLSINLGGSMASYLYSLGDLSFSDNQSEVLIDGAGTLYANTRLEGVTLRANGNRLGELTSSFQCISLWARALDMNTVTSNQVDHCIRAEMLNTDNNDKLVKETNTSQLNDDPYCGPSGTGYGGYPYEGYPYGGYPYGIYRPQ